MILQILRRCVQASVFVVVILFALLSLYAHYRAAGAIDDPQLMAGMRGEMLTTFIHPYLEELSDPQRLLDGNWGTVWSMRIFGFDVTDPLAAAEMLAASKSVHWPLLGSIVLPVILTLFLGKVFCSWICPGYVLFEVAGKFRRLLKLAEISPGEVKFAFANKYIFLVVGLCIAAITSAPLFALIYPPAVISRVLHAWVFDTAMTAMIVLLLVIVAVEVFVSPRWWCRTMCPGGALYGLLGWARPVRVKLVADNCDGCKDCIPVCEAGINPITQSASIECDNCGVCIRHCKPSALKYTLGLPKTRSNRRAKPGVSGPKAAAMLAVLMFLCIAEPAAGHHILGLPHYSYKENYPQRPTLEYPATTGPFDVLLTSYPGKPLSGEPANLAYYIKDRETQNVYSEPVTIRILQTSTFGDNTVIRPPTERRVFDNEYKLQVTFPEDGEYVIELSMLVEGRVEVIPFLMVVGDPSATASFVVAGVMGTVVLFVIARAVQIKRRRRAAAAGD